MPNLETLTGTLAAICTTVSYVPQLRKAWSSGETGDLSLKMLLFLGAGLALWTVYGMLRADAVIMAANGVSLTLLGVIVYLKLRNEHP
jgi:MtN3 and saliva related transmembrane protein